MNVNRNVKILKKGEKNFPHLLEELNDCPDILYAVGDETILNEFALAVIGARKCTVDGKYIAENLSKDFALSHINVISGFATGIDSIAHKSCIDNGGKTIAVLGGGFNYLYPKENEELYEEIIRKGGVLISEYMPDEPPRKSNFRMRNRIIAALSNGVIVIEAREKSGSLITVKYARKLNKKIFVVPGNIREENYMR